MEQSGNVWGTGLQDILRCACEVTRGVCIAPVGVSVGACVGAPCPREAVGRT